MAHQFKPVDRDAEMLLPHNMLDWVPEGHAVRVVIDTVESVVTPDLAARLVPSAPKGSAAGPARYDPVMLLTVWMYAYLRGVLSTRAVEDRCRYDATFRVACGRAIPDHTTFSRFRRHLFGLGDLAEDLFCRVLYVCACAGLGRLSVVAGDGVKIAANASKEASRTEPGLRKLAAQVIAGARKAAADEDADKGVLPGTDLLLGADTAEAFLQGEADSLGQTLPRSQRQFTSSGIDRGVFDIERHTQYFSTVDNDSHGTMPCALAQWGEDLVLRRRRVGDR